MKTKFRKTIIKFFALDYIVNLFGTTVNFTRGANIIYPLMLLNMMYIYIMGCASYILFTFLLISIFFGFFYFLIFPIKTKEYYMFDDVQKFIMSTKMGIVNKTLPKPNSFWVILVNPLITIIFLIIILLC